MIDLYPKLIESALEFRVYSKQKLNEFFKEPNVIDENLETCPLADGYEIHKL